uniref:Uncharacterized protein n=1 Tax=Romanomermis culicivorax TaxID=13658 RepID=A0A915JC26_ROMCU
MHTCNKTYNKSRMHRSLLSIMFNDRPELLNYNNLPAPMPNLGCLVSQWPDSSPPRTPHSSCSDGKTEI